MDMGAFFRDYGTPLALAIAGLNTIISLFIGQYFKNSPRLRIVLVVASVALISLGVGASFYSQHQIVASKNAEKEKRIAMKDLFGEAINECTLINEKPRTESEEDDAYVKEAGAWVAKTSQLVEKAYGKGEADLFMDDAGIPMMSSQGHPNVLMRHKMIARIQRLNELMSRVDTITMQPDFDPKKYR